MLCMKRDDKVGGLRVMLVYYKGEAGFILTMPCYKTIKTVLIFLYKVLKLAKEKTVDRAPVLLYTLITSLKTDKAVMGSLTLFGRVTENRGSWKPVRASGEVSPRSRPVESEKPVGRAG